MRPCTLELRWHNSPDHIPGLVAIMAFLSFAMAKREAVVINHAHLPIAMPTGFDEQMNNPLDLKLVGCALANTTRVKPVRLWQSSPDAVEPGQSSRSTFNWPA